MVTRRASGFSPAGRWRRDPRYADIPIIIATAVTSATGLDLRPRTPEDLATMRVAAYFDKPIPPRRLLEKVAELLR